MARPKALSTHAGSASLTFSNWPDKKCSKHFVQTFFAILRIWRRYIQVARLKTLSSMPAPAVSAFSKLARGGVFQTLCSNNLRHLANLAMAHEMTMLKKGVTVLATASLAFFELAQREVFQTIC